MVRSPALPGTKGTAARRMSRKGQESWPILESQEFPLYSWVTAMTRPGFLLEKIARRKTYKSRGKAPGHSQMSLCFEMESHLRQSLAGAEERAELGWARVFRAKSLAWDVIREQGGQAMAVLRKMNVGL